MKIVCLVKQVPQPGAIEFDQETKTLRREGVPLELNPFDRYAVQHAVALRKQEGGEVVVRIDVSLPVPELACARIALVAQRLRRAHVPVFAHVRGRLLQRDVRRVRLRGAGKIDRRLREVQPRFRQADVLDGVRRRDRDQQRARVRVADVLGGEHDHPPRDVAGVLAALEHRREVVHGGIGIRAAHRLDEGADEVVVLAAALVVQERPLRRRFLRVPRLEGRSFRLRGQPRELDDVQRVPRIAARELRDPFRDVFRNAGTELGRATPHDDEQLLVRQRLERVDLAA